MATFYAELSQERKEVQGLFAFFGHWKKTFELNKKKKILTHEHFVLFHSISWCAVIEQTDGFTRRLVPAVSWQLSGGDIGLCVRGWRIKSYGGQCTCSEYNWSLLLDQLKIRQKWDIQDFCNAIFTLTTGGSLRGGRCCCVLHSLPSPRDGVMGQTTELEVLLMNW